MLEYCCTISSDIDSEERVTIGVLSFGFMIIMRMSWNFKTWYSNSWF